MVTSPTRYITAGVACRASNGAIDLEKPFCTEDTFHSALEKSDSYAPFWIGFLWLAVVIF